MLVSKFPMNLCCCSRGRRFGQGEPSRPRCQSGLRPVVRQAGSAIGRAARSGLLLGGLPAPVLHFALVEAHTVRVAYRR